jgi:hypothetical protein
MTMLSIQEKIEFEKRKRNQAYISLDYQLNATSFFDFFSADALQTVQTAKYIAYSNYQEKVTLNDFIITFCYIKSDLLTILNEFGVCEHIFKFTKLRISSNESNKIEKEEKISKFNLKWLKSKSYSKLQTIKQEVKDIYLLLQNEQRELPKFSDELGKFLEKATKNALEKFKTPIVTLEILFFTLIDENKELANFLEKELKKDLSFQFLKYRVYQRIHRQESSIREMLPQNYHYFAYLLKSQLTEEQFDYLINNEMLLQSILYFRNLLIAKILKQDIFPILRSEVQQSMYLTRFRKYSI